MGGGQFDEKLSIAIIQETREIYTHGTYYSCSTDLNLIESEIQKIIVQELGDAKDKVVSQAVLNNTVKSILELLDSVEEKVNNLETTVIPGILGKVDQINSYTVNGHKISESPVITKEDIELGNVTNDAQVKRSEMGVAGGVATLDDSGKVPSSQLPAFVDEIVEVDTKDALPKVGEAEKIYVTKDTNLTYRWGGTEYVEISESIALGETSSTAYAGDKGKATTDKVNSHVENFENPHQVTKEQIGLGNVDNTSDLDKPVSTATQKLVNDTKAEVNSAIGEVKSAVGTINADENTEGSFKKGDKETLDAAKAYIDKLLSWYEGE